MIVLSIGSTACRYNFLENLHIPPPPPQDCTTLSKMTWRVGGGFEHLQLAVGASQVTSLSPGREPQCTNSITSVTWSVDKASVASVLPDSGNASDFAWITGVSSGTTAVKAHLVFRDGVGKDAQSLPVQVAPPVGPPPGSILIAKGRVPLAPPPPVGSSDAFVRFTLKSAGSVHITVDWTSLVDVVYLVVYHGGCSPTAATRNPVDGFTTPVGDKPLVASGSLSGGEYTLGITNGGPGAETARYEIRVTPV